MDFMRTTGNSMWFKYDFYQSKAWRDLRVVALKKYGSICMKCGSKEDIQVDHILARSLFPYLKLKLYNLQILCGNCNRKKGQKVLDFRPVPYRLYYSFIYVIPSAISGTLIAVAIYIALEGYQQ